VTIDSKGTVDALKFYTDLMSSTSAGGRNMGYGEVAAEYIAGRAAMACNFLAFFPSIANPGDNPDFWDKTGFFNSPGHVGADGTERRAAALGGQGMSINAHISPERQQRAKDFLKWFSEAGTQKAWAEKGGFTSNKTVLAGESFRKAAPYNPLFDDMMKACQREFCAVFQDGANPVEAVREIQREHESILRKRGRIR
jgi:multiple sugar transport system substrate-binding protein